MTEEKKLNVWYNDPDWVIAYSAQDAETVWAHHTGDIWEQDFTEWEIDIDNEFTMLWEDDPSEYSQPENAEIGKGDDGLWYVKASTDAWIEHKGRGFLCSIMDW